jgi:copper transport protein
MRSATLVASAVIALLGSAGRVRAADPPRPVVHAILERSVPAAGDTLDVAPRELVLTFSGLIEEAGAALRLLGPDGRTWSLEPRRAPDRRTLGADLPALAAGGYRLEWRVVSADGHPIGGDFVFFVRGSTEGELAPPPPSAGEGANAGTPDAARVSRVMVVSRALVDLALLPLAGLLLFAGWRRGKTTPLTLRVLRGLAVAAPVLALLYTWLWASEALGPQGGLSDLLSLTTGRALAAEASLALLVPWALFLARRVQIAAVLALLAVAGGGFGGHPASYTPLLSVPASVAHVTAAAVWVGGLVLLVTERGSAAYEVIARRVSAAAFLAVVVVAVSGIAQTWAITGFSNLLLTSAFGLVVLAKVVGLAGLIAFGAYHRVRLVPVAGSSDGGERLARSVSREVALAACVIVLAALLSHIPPTV